jgi:hypothetical protein
MRSESASTHMNRPRVGSYLRTPKSPRELSLSRLYVVSQVVAHVSDDHRNEHLYDHDK